MKIWPNFLILIASNVLNFENSKTVLNHSTLLFRSISVWTGDLPLGLYQQPWGLPENERKAQNQTIKEICLFYLM